MFAGRMPQLLMHRFMAAVLVACSLACCCPDRSFTALLAGEAAVADSGCCGGCCIGAPDNGSPDDGARDTDDEPRPHDGRCLGDCCNKADFKAPPFRIACDRVGAPLPEPLVSRDMVAASGPVLEPTRIDDDIGEPPPWRLLLVSARLRI
jgi:hypothetical protein